MTMPPDKLARVLKVLSVSTRLRIVELLRGRTLCVNALARKLDVTQGAVSQHLRVLKDLGLIHGERRSYRIHYFLNQERLAEYQELAQTLLGESFVVKWVTE